MRNSNFLLCLLIVVLVSSIIINFFLLERKETSSSPKIANPASVYCINQGGRLEIRKDKQQNEYGVCIFTSGKECEEWAFFRGECPQTGPTASFCGSSTKGECTTNTDCATGGCSSQICQSINEESIISTCEYRDCYDAKKYNLECQCLNQQCQWASSY